LADCETYKNYEIKILLRVRNKKQTALARTFFEAGGIMRRKVVAPITEKRGFVYETELNDVLTIVF